ncbi:hypothetical protein ABT369_39485 [Dactylosporangium sp. NPDC000244]|uniref:hypothetical protein n=1 Tax=Dactylosporangium sp. NPDC000244 TaxID=3154365 RepID=UPI003323DF5A
MSDFWLGVAAVPAAILVLAAGVVLALGAVALVGRVMPAHWSLRGPQRRARDARELFRWVNAAGRHMSTFRRLFSIGPFVVYVGRYRPGQVDEEAL